MNMKEDSPTFFSAARHSSVMGRSVRGSDDEILLDWPAVRLTFGPITGTQHIALRMHGGHSVLGYHISETGSSRSDSSDGVLLPEQSQKVISHGILNCYLHFRTRDYSLEPRKTEVLDSSKQYDLEIWKRDDPGVGIVHVYGLVLDAGGSCSCNDDVKPEQATTIFNPPRRHIEFVGDSDTVGFGNLARKSGLIYSVCCELPLGVLGLPAIRKATDATRSFGAYVAAKLDCDYSIIAQSGIGAVYSSFDDQNMCDVYGRALFSRATSARATSEQLPDLIVVYIGDNDQAFIDDTSFCDSDRHMEEKLCDGFTSLLRTIRSRHPCVDDNANKRGDHDNIIASKQASTIPIVVVLPHEDAALACMMSRCGNKKTIQMQRASWSRAVEAAGGDASGIYTVDNLHEPNIQLNSRKDYGMMLHWNANSCEKWAAGLAPQLRGFLDL